MNGTWLQRLETVETMATLKRRETDEIMIANVDTLPESILPLSNLSSSDERESEP